MGIAILHYKNEIYNDLNDEKLVEKLKENREDKLAFEILFKRCSSDLYKFLVSKKCSKEDAEDIIMDYFTPAEEKKSEFEVAIERFDINHNYKFINFVKKIILYRFINNQKKKIKKDSIDNVILCNNDNYFGFTNIFLEDLKEKILNIILNLSNENYKLAIICRLCLPFKLTIEEISEILEINRRTLSTHLYRGIEKIQKIMKEDDFLKNLDFETINNFISNRYIHFDKDTLNILDDNPPNKKEIFKKLLFERKTIEELNNIFGINSSELKSIIKNGIYEIINKLTIS